MSRRTGLRAAPSIAAFLLMASSFGCMSLRSNFGGFDELDSDEVAVVGLVELDPPLGPAEQDDPVSTAIYETRNIMYVDVWSKLRALERTVSMSMGKNSIQAHLGQPFRVILPKSDRFINGGYIFMKQRRPVEVSSFQLGAEIPLEPGDRAVYIGRLVYHRDRFNTCVRLEIVDDYEHERVEFEKLFGTSAKLEKRLIGTPDAPGEAAPDLGSESGCSF